MFRDAEGITNLYVLCAVFCKCLSVYTSAGYVFLSGGLTLMQSPHFLCICSLCEFLAAWQ